MIQNPQSYINRISINGGRRQSRTAYGRLLESGSFRQLESGFIRLLEYNNYGPPVTGGRVGIDFTIGTSALA